MKYVLGTAAAPIFSLKGVCSKFEHACFLLALPLSVNIAWVLAGQNVFFTIHSPVIQDSKCVSARARGQHP